MSTFINLKAVQLLGNALIHVLTRKVCNVPHLQMGWTAAFTLAMEVIISTCNVMFSSNRTSSEGKNQTFPYYIEKLFMTHMGHVVQVTIYIALALVWVGLTRSGWTQPVCFLSSCFMAFVTSQCVRRHTFFKICLSAAAAIFCSLFPEK